MWGQCIDKKANNYYNHSKHFLNRQYAKNFHASPRFPKIALVNTFHYPHFTVEEMSLTEKIFSLKDSEKIGLSVVFD